MSSATSAIVSQAGMLGYGGSSHTVPGIECGSGFFVNLELSVVSSEGFEIASELLECCRITLPHVKQVTSYDLSTENEQGAGNKPLVPCSRGHEGIEVRGCRRSNQVNLGVGDCEVEVLGPAAFFILISVVDVGEGVHEVVFISRKKYTQLA